MRHKELSIVGKKIRVSTLRYVPLFLRNVP